MGIVRTRILRWRAATSRHKGADGCGGVHTNTSSPFPTDCLEATPVSPLPRTRSGSLLPARRFRAEEFLCSYSTTTTTISTHTVSTTVRAVGLAIVKGATKYVTMAGEQECHLRLNCHIEVACSQSQIQENDGMHDNRVKQSEHRHARCSPSNFRQPLQV